MTFEGDFKAWVKHYPNRPQASSLLENLLISEVVEIARAKRPSVQQWIDKGLISRPPVVGKHRRFSAENTIEVILMVALNDIGIKPSAATQLIQHIDMAELIEMIDAYSIDFEKGRWSLDGSDCYTTSLALYDAGWRVDHCPYFPRIPKFTLIIHASMLLEDALFRALTVWKVSENNP